jgi:hypothetical protein
MGIDIGDLLDSSDQFEVGCISDATAHPDIPECDLTEATDQAGDTFITLNEGKVGKFTHAFCNLSAIDQDQEKAERTKIFHRVEYQFYMQLWCLKKLSDHGHMTSSHAMDPFVFGSDPAPEFFGICRSSDGNSLYVVMENAVLSGKLPDASRIQSLMSMR